MKRNYLISTLLMSCLICSCQKSENKEEYSHGQENDRKVVSVIDSRSYNPDNYSRLVSNAYNTASSIMSKLRPAFTPVYDKLVEERRDKLNSLFNKEVGLDEDGNKQWKIESILFSYKTKSAKNEDIELSGVLVFPNNTVEGIEHRLTSLSVFSHGGMVSVFDSVANMDYHSPVVFSNSALIKPDYQAAGISTGKDPLCVVSSNVLARQMADCILAAQELMEERGVSLADDGYTVSLGISQGAVIPIAFAKYYETEAPASFREKVKLKATLSAEGPQDFVSLFWYYSDNPDFNPILSRSIVNSLAAVGSEQLEGYDSKDFMADLFHRTTVSIEGRTMTYYEAMSLYQYNVLGTERAMPNTRSLADVLAPDMLTESGQLDPTSPKTQSFMRILSRQNDIFGWSPSLPLYIIHSPQDYSIPYQVSYDFYRQLSAQGHNPNVHFGEINIPGLPGQFIPNLNHFITSFMVNLKFMMGLEIEDYLDEWE